MLEVLDLLLLRCRGSIVHALSFVLSTHKRSNVSPFYERVGVLKATMEDRTLMQPSQAGLVPEQRCHSQSKQEVSLCDLQTR